MIKKPVDIIPFEMQKVWVVSKKIGDRFKFDRFDAVTPQNENQDWEQRIGGETYKFEKTYNFYALIAGDLSIPYIISFKGKSNKSGRELSTQMYIKNKAAGKLPPGKVMTLSGVSETNDKGTFGVWKTSISRDSTIDEIKACAEWIKLIRSGSVKVDNSDEEGEAAEAHVETQF
jgi:hypothetical protein